MSNKQAKKLTPFQMKEIGMEGEGWTIHDKLAIYRGLVKIYDREEDNQTKDSVIMKKYNYRKIATLRKEVEELRQSVNLSSLGEATRIRNVLQDDETILLAFKNSEPHKIEEELGRKLYAKRNYLDRILAKRRDLEKELVDKRLLLEDKRSLINWVNIEVRDKEQSLRNQIQEFAAKYLAAKNIEGVYRNIRNILYKDHRWYEAVMESLQQDSNLQQKSLMRATELGQLATEEFINMKTEYTLRETDVRRNMQIRMEFLREMQEQLANLVEETQYLVKTESVATLGLETASTISITSQQLLEDEVNEMNVLLKQLQEATLVPEFSDIYPRMQELLTQNRRLLEELDKNDKLFHSLLTKRNHGHLIFHNLKTSVHGYKASFAEKQKELISGIDMMKTEIEQIRQNKSHIAHLIIKICNGLHRLWQVISKVVIPKEMEAAFGLIPVRPTRDPSQSIIYEALHYLSLTEKRVKYVLSVVPTQLSAADIEKAFSYTVRNMSRQMGKPSNVRKEDKVMFELVIESEDSKVPSRQAIKARSKEIYDAATRNPYDIELPKSRKGKK